MSKKTSIVGEFFDAVLGEDRDDGWRWNTFKVCVLCLMIAGTMRACNELKASNDAIAEVKTSALIMR